ncbi:hypothetical protein BH09VER1_BH09VER1_30390 [soil metagenome]
MHQVAHSSGFLRAFALAGVLAVSVSLTSLQAQQFFGDAPQPDVPPVPEPTPPLFVPVKPGPQPVTPIKPVPIPDSTPFVPAVAPITPDETTTPAPRLPTVAPIKDAIAAPTVPPSVPTIAPIKDAIDVPDAPSNVPTVAPIEGATTTAPVAPTMIPSVAPIQGATTSAPVSSALPTVAPIPGSNTAPLFVPSDIQPPAIQATGNTSDVLPTTPPAPLPSGGGYVAPSSVSQTTPRRSAPAPAPTAATQEQINAWVPQATASRDGKLATQIGWAYFTRNEFSSAGVWFNQALEWNPGNGDAAYGLALSKFREGDISSAEAIANYRASSNPRLRTLQGDIYSRRGTEAYEAQQYADSLSLFNKASAARPLSRNEQIIVAWDLYFTKQYQASADLFEKLYRRSPDSVTGQGLYAAQSKLKGYDKLDTVSRQVGGPVRTSNTSGSRNYTSARSSLARQYYEANLFVAAAGAGGARYIPALQGYTSPSIAAGFGYRTKSGAEGLGQLQVVEIPVVEAQIYPANKFMLSGMLEHLSLRSGNLQPNQDIGFVPTVASPYTHDSNTSENNLWSFAVRLEYQDWLSWYITLGTTPLNGPIQAAPVGNAGIVWRDTHGYLQGELYSKSIKESITSWVGSEDPYSGQTWGRVTETGVSASFFHSVGLDNTIFLKGGAGELMGSNVKDNQHYYGTIAVSHIWHLPGFEYVTLGGALSGEAFDNNQNHFTYGNGGYFSPEYLAQGLIQAQFLTTEGRQWLAAGAVAAGVQNNKQAASPYFPLDPDGRNYGSQDSTTGIGLIQLSGAYLLTPNWAIGGSLNYAVTADYNEGGIYLWGRYFFEKRRGLFRTDLIGFSNLQP